MVLHKYKNYFQAKDILQLVELECQQIQSIRSFLCVLYIRLSRFEFVFLVGVIAYWGILRILIKCSVII